MSLAVFFLGIILFKRFNESYQYQAIQKAHINEVPRIGGLLIIVSITLMCMKNFGIYLNSFNIVVICCIPFLIPAIKEDLSHNVGPKIRFLGLLLSSGILLFFLDIDIYSIEIDFLQFFMNNDILCFIFFTLALVGLANGCNMIDGVNGLSPFYLLVSFLVIGKVIQDTSTILLLDSNISIDFIIIALVIFILFNYPFGKLFLGDHGNYFLALLLGILTIHFYSINNTLNTWGAILLLFYPTIETIFTILRRIFVSKRNILEADMEHLHSKLFLYLQKNNHSIYKANNMVLPILVFFWLIPGLIFYGFYNNDFIIILSLIIMTILYIISYIFITKLNNIS